MLVVKTTSPATSPSPAKLHPSNTAPSSRTSVARLRPWLRTYSKFCSCPVVYRLAADYGVHDSTRQGPSQIRRVVRSGDQSFPIHRPLLREVNEREVCRPANPEAPPLPDPAARTTAHSLDQTREREPTTE